MPKSAAKKSKKTLAQHFEEIAAIVGKAISRQLDIAQVEAVFYSDKVTMPTSHPVTARILSELIKRGMTPSGIKKE